MIGRGEVRAETKALSQVERRILRSLGVRIGAFSLYMPGLLRPKARTLAQAIACRQAPGWRPPTDALSPMPAQKPEAWALGAYGLRAVRDLAVPVEALERLDELLRAGVP